MSKILSQLKWILWQLLSRISLCNSEKDMSSHKADVGSSAFDILRWYTEQTYRRSLLCTCSQLEGGEKWKVYLRENPKDNKLVTYQVTTYHSTINGTMQNHKIPRTNAIIHSWEKHTTIQSVPWPFYCFYWFRGLNDVLLKFGFQFRKFFLLSSLDFRFDWLRWLLTIMPAFCTALLGKRRVILETVSRAIIEKLVFFINKFYCMLSPQTYFKKPKTKL